MIFCADARESDLLASCGSANLRSMSSLQFTETRRGEMVSFPASHVHPKNAQGGRKVTKFKGLLLSCMFTKAYTYRGCRVLPMGSMRNCPLPYTDLRPCFIPVVVSLFA